MKFNDAARLVINRVLRRGQKRKLAEFIGVAEGAISKWIRGDRGLHPKNLSRLVKYFDLDPELDLAKEPIFLSMTPMGAQRQKAWLLVRAYSGNVSRRNC